MNKKFDEDVEVDFGRQKSRQLRRSAQKRTHAKLTRSSRRKNAASAGLHQRCNKKHSR